MLITTPCVVTLTWRLQDTQGNLIDELADPLEFFFGGNDLLEKVEEALLDQSIGFAAELHLEPEHAFGDYDSSLVFFESRAVMPEGIEVGMQFDGPPPGDDTVDFVPEDLIESIDEEDDELSLEPAAIQETHKSRN